MVKELPEFPAAGAAASGDAHAAANAARATPAARAGILLRIAFGTALCMASITG
jgi:hypothetical protein